MEDNIENIDYECGNSFTDDSDIFEDEYRNGIRDEDWNNQVSVLFKTPDRTYNRTLNNTELTKEEIKKLCYEEFREFYEQNECGIVEYSNKLQKKLLTFEYANYKLTNLSWLESLFTKCKYSISYKGEIRYYVLQFKFINRFKKLYEA